MTWTLGAAAAALAWYGFDKQGFGLGFAAVMLLWWADKDWIRRAGEAALAKQAAHRNRPIAEQPLPVLLYEWGRAYESARDPLESTPETAARLESLRDALRDRGIGVEALGEAPGAER